MKAVESGVEGVALIQGDDGHPTSEECGGIDAARAFLRAQKSENTSGVTPLDLRVIVRPDPVEEVTKGGIIIPVETAEREKYATVKGTLIAAGENAWEEAAARSPHFTRPEPGERVMIAKYGGILFKGTDGADYRIMNDEDVIARLEEE